MLKNGMNIGKSTIQKWSIKSRYMGREFDKLDNLTLLINKQNNKANNKDFIFKKDNIYNDETLKITKDDKIGIMKYDKWTDEEINKRQKLLSETAKSIWEF